MNKRLMIAASIFLLAGVLATSAGWAQRQGGQGMMRGGPNQQGAMYGAYGMDQEQYQAMQEIGQKYQQEFIQLRTKLVNKRAEMQALLADSQVDPAKARDVYEEVQDVQADLFELRLEQRSELQAQGIEQGYGMNPGMMGGYGRGPGMMHGPGMGSGMMGGYRGGPGMMPGYGMGPGMMGGPGMGQGWMQNNW
ncbi:MAG: periplasmic heavy metal sensor [Thermodesulfobacteriota bacterium]